VPGCKKRGVSVKWITKGRWIYGEPYVSEEYQTGKPGKNHFKEGSEIR